MMAQSISNYRVFRYDGARARYMNRKLSTSNLTTDLGTTWSDYDGDEAYGDFTVASASPWTVTNTDQYEPGLWRKVGSVADYLHNDMLGTLRQTTGTTGTAGASRVFTAFGERLPGSATDRFGYVGAWGYQDTLDSGGAEVFPFLHVGARYYDPSSGRFLQRDPSGLMGGLNVYEYARSSPSGFLDPDGFQAQPSGTAGAATNPRVVKEVVGAVKEVEALLGNDAAREAANTTTLLSWPLTHA